MRSARRRSFVHALYLAMEHPELTVKEVHGKLETARKQQAMYALPVIIYTLNDIRLLVTRHTRSD